MQRLKTEAKSIRSAIKATIIQLNSWDKDKEEGDDRRRAENARFPNGLQDRWLWLDSELARQGSRQTSRWDPPASTVSRPFIPLRSARTLPTQKTPEAQVNELHVKTHLQVFIKQSSTGSTCNLVTCISCFTPGFIRVPQGTVQRRPKATQSFLLPQTILPCW